MTVAAAFLKERATSVEEWNKNGLRERSTIVIAIILWTQRRRSIPWESMQTLRTVHQAMDSNLLSISMKLFFDDCGSATGMDFNKLTTNKTEMIQKQLSKLVHCVLSVFRNQTLLVT